MELFTHDDLKSLLVVQDPACITLTLPADPAQAQVAPITLKNLSREAARQLEARGWKPQEAARLLEPVEGLVADALYWREQSGGLAIFLAGGLFQTYRVPMALDERVSVRDRFLLSPLLPLLAGDGRFTVLTLSRKHTRLLEGSRAGLAEVALEGMPEGFEEAFEKEGVRRGTFGSAPEEDDRVRIERFFREVDKFLGPILRRDCPPLVLAGVDHILSLYRAANTYPQLVEGGVPGSTEPLRLPELHQKAWALVRPIFEKAQGDAVAQYEALARTERASHDPHQVVPAAHYGRVETLLLARGAHLPGSFDAESGKVVVHRTAHPDAEDLLDLAAIQTLRHDGRVFSLAPDAMPVESTMAAVFRY